MKTSEKILPRLLIGITLFCVLFLLIGSINNPYQDNGVVFDEKTVIQNNFFDISPKSSQDWILTSIEIDDLTPGSDWTAASAEDWCSGSGTLNNPYIIENISIIVPGKTHGISISNSEAHFIIRNCYIINAKSVTESSGIYLYQTSNGNITDVKLLNNHRGIQIYNYCENNTISRVNISTDTNSDYGIYVRNYCDNITISSCNINSTRYGIYMYYQVDNSLVMQNEIKEISYNSYSNYYGTGIYVHYYCDYNTIIDNILSECEDYGVRVESISQYNNITGNTITNPLADGYEGIFISSSYNNVSFNNLNSDKNYGIRLHESTMCYVFNNSLTGSELGITASSNPTGDEFIHALIENNTFNGNPIYYYFGETNLLSPNFTNAAQIYLVQCSNSNISDLIYANHDYGILLSQCLNISIFNCNFQNSYFDGIYLYNSSDCKIFDNVIQGNARYGIFFERRCNTNIVKNNTIAQNGDYGFYMVESTYNNILNNSIIENTDHGLYLTTSSAYNNISNNNISQNDNYGMYLTSSSNNSIFDNNITSNYNYGVYITSCPGSILFNNNISNHRYHGVYISSSNWMNLSYNYIYNNGFISASYMGVDISSSDYLTIFNNTLIDNSNYAIRFRHSEFCTLSQNYMVGSGFGFNVYYEYDIRIKNEFRHYFDFTNKIDGKIIYYYMDEDGLSSPNFTNPGQIFLINTHNSEIADLEITNRQYGLMLYESDNNTVINCNFTSSKKYGLYMYEARNNTFINNNFSQSSYHNSYLYLDLTS
jgi:parallel beta-helix repeat protein